MFEVLTQRVRLQKDGERDTRPVHPDSLYLDMQPGYDLFAPYSTPVDRICNEVRRVMDALRVSCILLVSDLLLSIASVGQVYLPLEKPDGTQNSIEPFLEEHADELSRLLLLRTIIGLITEKLHKPASNSKDYRIQLEQIRAKCEAQYSRDLETFVKAQVPTLRECMDGTWVCRKKRRY